MPKRTDLKKIMIIGSGPIVIGQACEFDYSGTQACKALRQEGYITLLVNSNPATIMTDPETADITYIEPLTVEAVATIIRRERPDALLPTVGGQTALKLAIELSDSGILQEYGVEWIGPSRAAIEIAEDHTLFKHALNEVGLNTPGEESLTGWKEFELEVMRDLAGNVVVICSIENFDPVGVHTGDSITVAPAQTLSDSEYRRMRDMAITAIRKAGVETGGANIQFAVNPENGEMLVVEVNPRVSRSSALVSKATGIPIAKIAARLAVGYTLDEIANDNTSFEPNLDYVVTKIPKWDFEKFAGAKDELGTQMKSVGEVMGIGRTFKESLFKALRSLESADPVRLENVSAAELEQKLAQPNSQRFSYLAYAIAHGMGLAEIYRLSRIDPWFLDQLKQVMETQGEVAGRELEDISIETLARFKEMGLSDRRLAYLTACTEDEVRALRKRSGIIPGYQRVDTSTPYLYSTYEGANQAAPTKDKKIMILGSGPNRIGQGIEFDYCCCHAAFALREAGFETIMVNCNPETVSTDYDTSDRLYFEPLTFEDVMNVVDVEKPDGVIVQFGGQTPLNLARRLHAAGVPIIGTSPDAIDLAEDRTRFGALLRELGIPQPESEQVTTAREAKRVARRFGYPVLLRPSYVLGGRAMAIVYDDESLDRYVRAAVGISPDRPIQIDKFLEQAAEFDVDALADETGCVIAGIQEHIEEAGIHSGDSSCVVPPWRIHPDHLVTIRFYTRRLAQALSVRGLMNVQFAIKDNRVYVLEVNPRASRTVPFVSKATGVPLARIAALVMAGRKLSSFNLPDELTVSQFFVRSPVFPFAKFPEVGPILGPEMHSTGEVMGFGETFGEAYGKAMLGAGMKLPRSGAALISVTQCDKGQAVVLGRRLARLGFKLLATANTAERLREVGLDVQDVPKLNEGPPDVVDLIKNGDVALIINTSLGHVARRDEQEIRRAALQYNVPCVTTMTGARALVETITAYNGHDFNNVRALQELHAVERPAKPETPSFTPALPQSPGVMWSLRTSLSAEF